MSGKLNVEGLSAWYGRQQVLYDLTLDLPESGVTAVIGPPGAERRRS
jgi:ABC-type phosphate transport system ATPase subunit